MKLTIFMLLSIKNDLQSPFMRRGVRGVEGARLESVCAYRVPRVRIPPSPPFPLQRNYGWQAGALSKTARRSPPKIYRRLTLKIKRKIPRPGAGLKKMAGATRIELATSGLTARRSNQLNYAPAIIKSKGKRSKLIMEPFFCF